MLNHIKKWWSIYGATVLAVLAIIVPAVQKSITAHIAQHPALSTVSAVIAFIWAKISNSPK